jgi:DNA-binding transcriptional MerR regulator
VSNLHIMNTETDSLSYTVQVFAPDREALYPIDVAAHLARMPKHIVLVCCRRGLVTPQIDPEYGGLYFDQDAIRTLQRIEYLRGTCGVNLAGIGIILELMKEVMELREMVSG